MNQVDFLILLAVALVLGTVIYFRFIKKRSIGPCAHCSEARKCKDKGKSLVEDYHQGNPKCDKNIQEK